MRYKTQPVHVRQQEIANIQAGVSTKVTPFLMLGYSYIDPDLG